MLISFAFECRQRSRSLTLTGFAEDTNVGRYVARRDAKIAEYEPDVPVCESIAIENAANCNALPLDEASSTCSLPKECDSAGIRYYCEISLCSFITVLSIGVEEQAFQCSITVNTGDISTCKAAFRVQMEIVSIYFCLTFCRQILL